MAETDIVTRIVEAVAAADGVDPAELDPLYDYMNPEVLHKISRQERGQWSLTFQYSDHQVTVSHDSRILVDGVAYTPNASASQSEE
jgi:hypothetical protein